MDKGTLGSRAGCARLLAFCGYKTEEIRDALAKRFNLPLGAAEAEAKRAVDQKQRRDREDAAKLGKDEAALEAEHDLSATTWR